MKAFERGVRRFLTYALVGCFDTAMDWLAFTFCHSLLLFSPVNSQAVGYFVGAVCSYLLNGRITFRDGEGERWLQCIKFVVWNGFSLVLSALLIQLLTAWGMSVYIAKVVVTLEVAVVNYIGYKYVVFHVRQETRREK